MQWGLSRLPATNSLPQRPIRRARRMTARGLSTRGFERLFRLMPALHWEP